MKPIPCGGLEGPVGHTIGYLDLGTNSIRLLVVRLTGEGAYTVLSDQKETVRLGNGEFRTGNLTPEAMDRAVQVVTRFAALARSFGAEEFVAVATSATREARNRETLLSRLRSEAGLDVHIVPGEEEARLIYLGVTGGLHLEGRTALVIDIGGGSTELAAGTSAGCNQLASIKLGSIRLGTLFPAHGPNGAYTRADCRALREYCASTLLRPLERFAGDRFDLVLGSSGTIQTLASVAGNAPVLSAGDLSSTVRTLATLGIERRRRVPGINPGRADIIVPGGAILEAVFDALDLDGLMTTSRGLKEGLVVDHLTRRGYLFPPGTVPVREQSVRRLARNCHSAVAHGEHVADLAGQLFDSAKALGLHLLGDEARELLAYSARLHDIGTAISFSNHHLHSQYILTQSELLGFDERERIIMGLIVRFHRKRLPGPKAPELQAIPPHERGTVLVLAIFLRLAEALDRTHNGLVRSAVFEDDGDGVRLVLQSASDPHLEVWGVGNQARSFSKIFGRHLTLVVRTG